MIEVNTMELYREILTQALAQEKTIVLFPDLRSPDLDVLINNVCYTSLLRIRDIIRDDRFSDEACYQKIEEIICELEQIGSSGGFRHDFG